MKQLPAERQTLTVPEAGRILGLNSRVAAYAAAKRGDIPTIKIGNRVFVPRAALEKMLGTKENAINRGESLDSQQARLYDAIVSSLQKSLYHLDQMRGKRGDYGRLKLNSDLLDEYKRQAESVIAYDDEGAKRLAEFFKRLGWDKA